MHFESHIMASHFKSLLQGMTEQLFCLSAHLCWDYQDQSDLQGSVNQHGCSQTKRKVYFKFTRPPVIWDFFSFRSVFFSDLQRKIKFMRYKHLMDHIFIKL